MLPSFRCTAPAILEVEVGAKALKLPDSPRVSAEVTLASKSDVKVMIVGAFVTVAMTAVPLVDSVIIV